MGWICENCSTNNEDVENSCFVCGAARPKIVAKDTHKHPSAGLTVPESVETGKRSSAKVKVLVETDSPDMSGTGEKSTRGRAYGDITPPSLKKLITPSSTDSGSSSSSHSSSSKPAPSGKSLTGASGTKRVGVIGLLIELLLVWGGYISGQIALYVIYYKYGDVLLLTRLLKASGNYDFSMTAYFSVTGVIGFLEFDITAYVCSKAREENNLKTLFIIALTFFIFIGVFPATSVIPYSIYAFVLLIRSRSDMDGCKRCAVVATIIFSVITVIFSIVNVAIGDVYTITFNNNGVSGVSKRSVRAGSDMPSASVPENAGYKFEGYYDSNGVQYYDENMNSVKKWDKNSDSVLYAKWEGKKYTVTLDPNYEGADSRNTVVVEFNGKMPKSDIPKRTGYSFEGYYDRKTDGFRYYGETMNSERVWDKISDSTLYAHWRAKTYYVTFNKNGGSGGTDRIAVTFGSDMPEARAPQKSGFSFGGYYYDTNGVSVPYYNAKMASVRCWAVDANATLNAHWVSLLSASASPNRLSDISSSDISTVSVSNGSGNYIYTVEGDHPGVSVSVSSGSGSPVTVTVTRTAYDSAGTVWLKIEDKTTGAVTYANISYTTESEPIKTCIANGTLITLADGTQKPVEQLTGNESLLVWDIFSGGFTSASILVIDVDGPGEYNVTELCFSDGTSVEIIYEHAFYDIDENKYVFLNEDSQRYIGHRFVSGLNGTRGEVTLTDVKTVKRNVTPYSPVTYGHLCYFVNGMLSMPGGVQCIVNYIELDADLKADADTLAADIELYGLYTYEEFAELTGIPEFLFDAVCGKYLKIAVGKGLVTAEELVELYNNFAFLFE